MKNYIAHCGFNNVRETNLIKRYAESYGYEYWWEGIANPVFKSATKIKYAKFAVIWNGYQHSSQQVANLCRHRNIPFCFLEWGMLPQSETFFVDPFGFCGDSILAKDLSWIKQEDFDLLNETRRNLQLKYPVEQKDYILVPLQIENDTQVLNYSHYNNMEQVVEEIENMYPDKKILVRLHPKSTNKDRKFNRAEIAPADIDFFELAKNAELVVAVTSTTLYESGILGVPVKALGKHPLSIQPKENFEKIFAGALALTINRETGNLRSVLERFNLKPL
jgi:capsule polysaccharide export protein KpsC/LpsZ